METKTRLVESTYNHLTGTATVVLEIKKKLYTGHAYLADGDEDIESPIVGGMYAEVRAQRDFLKNEIKKLQIKCINLSTRKFVIFRQFRVNRLLAQKAELQKTNRDLAKWLYKDIKMRPAAIAKLREKHEARLRDSE